VTPVSIPVQKKPASYPRRRIGVERASGSRPLSLSLAPRLPQSPFPVPR
jgi:hypothetical protein